MERFDSDSFSAIPAWISAANKCILQMLSVPSLSFTWTVGVFVQSLVLLHGLTPALLPATSKRLFRS